jgi:hypothetical protein
MLWLSVFKNLEKGHLRRLNPGICPPKFQKCSLGVKGHFIPQIQIGFKKEKMSRFPAYNMME